MLTLPDAIVALLVPFATLFTSPTWRKAQVLLIGAILTPGQRTVAAALRVMGRSDQRDYARYHEVLNRAVWSSRQAARILLVLLLQHLDGGDGPLAAHGTAFNPSNDAWSPKFPSASYYQQQGRQHKKLPLFMVNLPLFFRPEQGSVISKGGNALVECRPLVCPSVG